MPQLSIVVPTFNESGNVAELCRRVSQALPGVDWELIFVDDDSPDGTSARLRELAQADSRVRCIQRIGRRGLVTACLEGMLSSSAPLVAVMDADLQHDERLLPDMIRALDDADLDLVVGSRYVEGGGIGQWNSARAALSRQANWLARRVLRVELSDPMSGFFMIRRTTVEACVRAGLSGIGFKILLDLLASSPQPLRLRELPYQFRARHSGESKLDTTVAWEYFMMLLDRLLGGIVPVRFIAFTLVGGLGLLVHMACLALLFKVEHLGFAWSQGVATLVAMTSNFLLNNVLTYRDLRLRGWGLIRGWVSFSLACGVGAWANVGVAAWLYERQDTDWVLSAVAGVLVGAVWNYAVTAVYTWKRPRES